VKELDFLPEWYKHDQRRQSHVRRQYLALLIVFLLMVSFNLTATHRASRAAAEVADLENQRVCSEAVVQEFDRLTRKLNELKTRASLVEQMDSRVDLAAVLAELSHTIGDPVVLRRVEMLAEPLGGAGEKGPTRGAVVRVAGPTAQPGKGVALGSVKFRIVLTGVAVHPADVADLVSRLDASPYFQRVDLAFYKDTRTLPGTRPTPGAAEARGAARPEDTVDLTEFEIACYLANYVEKDPL